MANRTTHCGERALPFLSVPPSRKLTALSPSSTKALNYPSGHGMTDVDIGSVTVCLRNFSPSKGMGFSLGLGCGVVENCTSFLFSILYLCSEGEAFTVSGDYWSEVGFQIVRSRQCSVLKVGFGVEG